MTPSAEPKLISIADIVARRGDPPWAEALFTDGRNDVVLICDEPGRSNDAHAHPDFNEWWIVLQGELLWDIGDYAPIRAKKGDVIMAPKGRRHAIRTVGNENSLRLGVTHPDSNHDTKGTRSSLLRPVPQNEPPNRLQTSLEYMLDTLGEPPWAMSILEDDRNRANLICHAPGMTDDARWFPDFNEWWAILGGELTWEFGEGRPVIHAEEGDIVFAPKGMRRHIRSVGEDISLRLAVTAPE